MVGWLVHARVGHRQGLYLNTLTGNGEGFSLLARQASQPLRAGACRPPASGRASPRVLGGEPLGNRSWLAADLGTSADASTSGRSIRARPGGLIAMAAITQLGRQPPQGIDAAARLGRRLGCG